jgi:RNase adapter protein RapZ
VTGLSGAGKTQAMDVFEDSGWFCIDNLPPRMLSTLADLGSLDGSRLDRVAVACDVRGGIWFEEVIREIDRLREQGVEPRIIFLEADSEILVNRFRETRRRHPLARGGSVLEGIARERELLEPLRDRADVVIDTSDLTIWDLRRLVTEAMGAGVARSRLRITFASFGFKHGTPRDCDLLFDVRFITNPHYQSDLAPLTGRDQPVIDFLAKQPELGEFLEHLGGLLDFLIPAYENEGKQHLVIGFGCTGGRHRSVRVADAVAEGYRDSGYEVTVEHRDVHRGPSRPPAEEEAAA